MEIFNSKNNIFIKISIILLMIKYFLNIQIYVFILPLLLVLFYSLCKFEKLYNYFKIKIHKESFYYGVYFSIFFLSLYNPLKEISVKKFDRIIGKGIINNIDISRIITAYIYYITMFLIFFILFSFLINYLKLLKKKQKKIFGFLDNLVILAIADSLIRIFKIYTSKNFEISFSTFFLVIIISTYLGYLIFDVFIIMSISKFSQLFIISAILNFLLLFFLNFNINDNSYQMLFIFIFVLILFGFYKVKELKIRKLAICFSFLPFITSIYIEIINICNQRGIFIKNPYLDYLKVILTLIAIFIVFSFSKKKKIWNWKKYSYPILVIGFSAISTQIPFINTYNLDLIEGANSSVLISDFFYFHKIPILENYGGHMMTSVWEGIFYGILNKDYVGAIFSPYAQYFTFVLLSILFYYTIAYFWNREISLFIVLFFPFYEYWFYFGMGILVLVFLINYLKKKSVKNIVLLILSIIWILFYRLDLGFAFSVSALLSLIIYCYKLEKIRELKRIFLVLCCIILLVFLFGLFLCTLKNINFLDRIIEFININISNKNWAYGDITKSETMFLFVWGYIVIPSVMTLLLMYMVIGKKVINTVGEEKWLVMLVLNISYFINIPRGLVRHSLYENKIYTIIWTSYIFLALFITNLTKKNKNFLIIFTFFMIFDHTLLNQLDFDKVIVNNISLKIRETLKLWTSRSNNGNTLWEKLNKEKKIVNRVIIAPKLVEEKQKYEEVIGTLLEKNETFIDFSNKSTMYSLLKRKNPVYVSQSPMQLSGEYSQKLFIKEIKNVPIIIMPSDNFDKRFSTTLDEISNAYRYYKVSEYIYQNYEPLIKFKEDFSVWCLKDRCNKLRDKLREKVVEIDNIKLNLNGLKKNNIKVMNTKEVITLKSDGKDPYIDNLQNVLNLGNLKNKKIRLVVNYSTNSKGNLQLFYTTEKNENYSEQKSIMKQLDSTGTVFFDIFVSEYRRLRLDIPDNSYLNILSVKIKSDMEYINYGYDGPNVINNEVSYISSFHNYKLNYLPFIWANYDNKKSIDNKVVVTGEKINDFFKINPSLVKNKKNGNYLAVTLLAPKDDIETILKIGDLNNNGNVLEKVQYLIKTKKGVHKYLFRISSDYYWYLNQLKVIQVVGDKNIKIQDVKILEGD